MKEAIDHMRQFCYGRRISIAYGRREGKTLEMCSWERIWHLPRGTAGETAFKQKKKKENLDCVFIFFTDTLLPTALTAKVMFLSACCGVIG